MKRKLNLHRENPNTMSCAVNESMDTAQRIDYHNELRSTVRASLTTGGVAKPSGGGWVAQSADMEATTACATKAMSANPSFSRGSASPAMPSQPAATYCAACSTSRAPRYRPAATARAAHRSAGTAPAYSCRHDHAAAVAPPPPAEDEDGLDAVPGRRGVVGRQPCREGRHGGRIPRGAARRRARMRRGTASRCSWPIRS